MRFEFELSDIRVCDWPQVRTRVTYSYMSVPCFSYVSTAFLHAQLDELPFFAALQAGTLPAASIVTLLRSLAIAHAVLE
jgi:hypothetical protein